MNTSTQARPQGAATALTPIQEFRQILNSTGIATRLGEMMGEKQMARFKSSMTQIVTGNYDLQKCSPMSVISAGLIAANIGLDIRPQFGQSAIIPYGKQAQLQIMTKGWIQLAQRSGKYSWINADAVYADEYQGFDLLSGMVYLKAISGGYREQGRKDKIIGFFAAFELTNGGRKVLYMTLKEIEAHARTYSKSYKFSGEFPIPDSWKPNLETNGIGWNAGWYAMARKTVLKLLIQRWGELSIEMEEAVASDQASFRDIDSEPVYIDNEGELLEDGAPEPQKTLSDNSDAQEGETTPESNANASTAQEMGNQSEIERMFAEGARN